MVKADIAFVVFVLIALGVGSGDPEMRLSVGPAHHVAAIVLQVEAKKFHQRRTKRLRLGEIPDGNGEMVDARCSPFEPSCTALNALKRHVVR